jgi:hypothetical protein
MRDVSAARLPRLRGVLAVAVLVVAGCGGGAPLAGAVWAQSPRTPSKTPRSDRVSSGLSCGMATGTWEVTLGYGDPACAGPPVLRLQGNPQVDPPMILADGDPGTLTVLESPLSTGCQSRVRWSVAAGTVELELATDGRETTTPVSGSGLFTAARGCTTAVTAGGSMTRWDD